MPAPKKSVIHFCASCGMTVACWAVWIVLGVTLAALGYVAVARELPVPDFLLRRAEARMAASGFQLQFGRARLDPSGRVLLEDVRLRARQFDDPLLTCRLLYAQHDWWSLLAGRTEPQEVRVEGAALHLPAMLSPSGTTEALVRDLSFTVHYRDRAWQLDQFVGRLGALALTVHGEIAPPTHAGAPREVALDEVAGAYLRYGRQVAPLIHRLAAFDTPSLAVRLTPARADLLFTATAAHRPWDLPLDTGALAATTSVRLDPPGLRPLRLHLAATRLDYAGQAGVDQLRAVVRAEFQPEGFTARALEVQAVAARVTAAGEAITGPGFQADVSAWPAVTTSLQARLDGEFLAAEVAAQLQEQSARLHAEGRVAPGLIARVLTTHTPRAAPYFAFGDPVAFSADAVLGPGWKFARLASRVDARRLDSHGVGVTAARGRIDITGTHFLAHDAYAEIGGSFARGSYEMDFATTDYRMLLAGQLRPEAISGWFRGDWWPAFWAKYFAFNGAPPAAEVDIRGRWRDAALSNNFIHARAASARVWGGDFEQVDALVFVRPNFAHAWNIDARRAGGAEQVTGELKRFAAPGTRDAARLEFDFTGNPEPALLGRILEGRADDVLAILRLPRPPDLHAWGAIDRGVADYRFTGSAPLGLAFYGFPLDRARVAGSIRGNDLKLDEIEFAAAGGTGRGRAALTGTAPARQLGFEVFVNGARLGQTIHAFEEYQAARAGRPYVPTPDSKFVRKAATSQLDVAFSAHGTAGQLASFTGGGNASLTGAQLGEVHLFGLLSQVLSGLSLSFSSLKLDAARATIELRDGTMYFPDVKVTGPSALIDAKGKYALAENALDFNAKFKPYEQPGSLLAAAVSLVVNPLTSILELKLSGPLGDPKWSVSVTTPSSTPSAPAPTPPPPPEAKQP